MEELIPLMVVGTGCISILVLVTTWARRRFRVDAAASGSRDLEERVRELSEQQERALAELEERQLQRLGELEERLDFAERLLTQQRHAPQLPPESGPRPTTPR
jgi:hypothetical protein